MVRDANERRLSLGVLFAFMAILAMLPGSGCQSRPPAAYGSSAWVEISGATQKEIFDTARSVFKMNGYKPIESIPSELGFEKPGDFKNNLLYGGLDAGVTLRVYLKIDTLENDVKLLHLRAKAVRSAGEKIEDPQDLSRMDRSSFQPLLDQIKMKLDPPKKK